MVLQLFVLLIFSFAGATDALWPEADAHLSSPPQQQQQQCSGRVPRPSSTTNVHHELWRPPPLTHRRPIAEQQKIATSLHTRFCISENRQSSTKAGGASMPKLLFELTICRERVCGSRNVQLWCATGQVYWDGDEFCDDCHPADRGEPGGTRKV